MKTIKLIDCLLLFIGNLIVFIVIYSSLFFSKTINLETFIILSFCTALFYTKLQIYKLDDANTKT